MKSKSFNPYESPRSIEQNSVSDTDVSDTERRHHLSNRFMSYVIGSVGTLLLTAGLLGLVGTLITMPIAPSGKETHFFRAVALIGIVVPAIGIAMISVSIFLWRSKD